MGAVSDIEHQPKPGGVGLDEGRRSVLWKVSTSKPFLVLPPVLVYTWTELTAGS